MAEAGVGIPGAEEVAQGDASAKQMEITTASEGGQPGTGTVTSQAPGGPVCPSEVVAAHLVCGPW